MDDVERRRSRPRVGAQRQRAGWPGRLPGIALGSLVIALGGCAGRMETQARRDLGRLPGAPAGAGRQEGAPRGPDGAMEETALDGSLSAYLRRALLDSPTLRARFASWRAATERIGPARQLPEPVISYAYFVRNVETRVGPQRHRLSVQQRFPWPTRLTAAADAQAQRAEAARRQVEAEALAVGARVARAYWRLWAVRARHEVAREQERLVEAVHRAVRGGVEVGARPLADLLQVELRLARLRDHHAAHRQAVRRIGAELVAAIGAPAGTGTPTSSEPPPPSSGPAEDLGTLRAAARNAPPVAAREALVAAGAAEIEAARAARFPGLGVGLDWIATGEAVMPNVPGSGDDAVLVSVQASVPLWIGSYRDAEEAARAETEARRSEAAAAARSAEAALDDALARIADSARRIALLEEALLPRGEAMVVALRGAYEAGRASLAQLLLGEETLLELRLERVDLRADHAIAWAELDAVVGRTVAPAPQAMREDPANLPGLVPSEDLAEEPPSTPGVPEPEVGDRGSTR